ncbi:MAG: prepilin-type N-terminal cleavage/methylation protein [Chthoniobacteraceae bacterium]|nr:prepilin-type N-terminal cleavage/methylation protein [Chthoniobacteraceae bacterium]
MSSASLDDHGLSPVYFDDHGVFIDSNAEPPDLARRLYRADARVEDWHERPANTSGLRAVIIELSWPVDGATGEATGKDNPKSRVTYGVTALTGPDWTLIYPPKIPEWKYQEKIEF